jgi:aryl-alcohol dehydrogenase-like predicted oxidoreductase
MKRRDFIKTAALGVGATWSGAKGVMSVLAEPAGSFSATDMVMIGRTGIKTSRLAMGTGTMGGDHHSNQTALGIQGLADLLCRGYDHGLRFFDTADSYGSHPHVAAALKRVPRENVTILTKSWARSGKEMTAHIERFRKELNTDYLDILLMHCLQEPDWNTSFRSAMEAISEAQGKGIVRAHGCSCHTLEALRVAAKEPWVQVMLSRINPIGAYMDADPETVLATLREGKSNGKGIIGMKILAQGNLRHRQDETLKYALSLGILDAFTIGAESAAEQDDLLRRIAATSV